MILMSFLPGVGFPPLPNTASNPRTYLVGKKSWREEALSGPLGPGVGTAGENQCPDSLLVCVGVWETLRV